MNAQSTVITGRITVNLKIHMPLKITLPFDAQSHEDNSFLIHPIFQNTGLVLYDNIGLLFKSYFGISEVRN